jgi:hypothetical protein
MRRARDGGLPPCSVTFDEDGAPAIFYPKRGMGQRQGAPWVHLFWAADCGQLRISSATAVGCETSGDAFFELHGGHWWGVYFGE